MHTHVMEAIPDFSYKVNKRPKRQDIGTVETNISIIRTVDMDPIVLPLSTFTCSLPTKEFIEEEISSRKHELFIFLTSLGMDDFDAISILQELIRFTSEKTSSFGYRQHYALSMWLTLYLLPCTQESLLDHYQLEEATHASIDEFEKNIRFRPASKREVMSLDCRVYNRKPKTSCIDENCSICLEKFETGKKVVTIPCGHEFDHKCIVDWLKVGHACPLCRFKLSCEDDNHNSQLTMVF
ncbi:unnamed protein product [Cochlearia groenlandica]